MNRTCCKSWHFWTWSTPIRSQMKEHSPEHWSIISAAILLLYSLSCTYNKYYSGTSSTRYIIPMDSQEEVGGGRGRRKGGNQLNPCPSLGPHRCRRMLFLSPPRSHPPAPVVILGWAVGGDRGGKEYWSCILENKIGLQVLLRAAQKSSFYFFSYNTVRKKNHKETQNN